MKEVDIGQPKNASEGVKGRGGTLGVPQGATVIAKNLVKKTDFIDRDGNKVDPATKQIVQRKDANDQ